MFRVLVALLISLPFPALLPAQSDAGSQLEFQVSAAQAWTDTGLDLQSGDVVKISASSSIAADKHTDSSAPVCSPAGLTNSAAQSNLPLPSAPAGALIARLHVQDASPILVGNGTDLHVADPSHLFLGMNAAGTASCQGSITVKVQKTSGSTSTNLTRGAQLKSQLSNAMGVFMSGQFGLKPEASGNNAASSAVHSGGNTAAVEPLSLSEQPLERDLRKDLDSLPRRVNDQFSHLGDMVNFVIIGSQKDMQAAMEASSWHVADTSNTTAVFNAVMQAYDSKDYLAMPMSILYLFGRKQDFGYEMAEPIAMVASRHHFRIWKAPFTWKGQEVWVGAGTHDIGFAKDQRNNSVTHKIDPSVDGERDNIGRSIQKANKVKSMAYYLPSDPVREAKNATGDSYHSDGRLLVIFLQ
ncbi:MAG TPA: LssY C-terminal domain-containing protein [Candidatus Sulfotelmatobacter sp.]|nr:LssY C-terminal domain-containing protein [Candidatus Sulfotelmatobacter sp.]